MHYEFIAGNLALDFANTVHNHGSGDPEDDLKGFSELISWARQAGLMNEREGQELSGQAQAHPAAAGTDLRRSLRVRELIYEVFSEIAREGKPRPAALAGLNSYFRQAMAQVGLRRVADGYEFWWEDHDRSLDRVMWAVTRAAVDLLTSGSFRRVRQCAGESCTWLFLDTSRNGLRRWCDMQACGNRAKVRRFRQRKRTPPGRAKSRLAKAVGPS